MFITYLAQRGYNDDIKSTHMQPANLFWIQQITLSLPGSSRRMH